MKVWDVNVLLAHFHPAHPQHEATTRWVSHELTTGEPFTVPDLVWVGFLRLATHRQVLDVPATFAEAWSYLDAVRRQPTYLPHAPDASLLDGLHRVALEASANADLVTDAYIAAVAVSLGAAVATFDRDFRKFDGVRVVEPGRA